MTEVHEVPEEEISLEDKAKVFEIVGAVYRLLSDRLGGEREENIPLERTWVAYSALVNLMAILMIERFSIVPVEEQVERVRAATTQTAWAVYTTTMTNLERRQKASRTTH